MKNTCFALAVCLYLLIAPGLRAADLRAVCGDDAKSETRVITSGNQTYTLHMGGRLDGEMTRDPVGYWGYDQFWEPNVHVRLENVGQVPVVNPWLRRTDRPDTRSLQSIVDFIVRPSMSDEEKAHRLWEFEIQNRFHATTEDDEVNDVVKRFNCYGYTLCYNESINLSSLWRTAGLKVRQGYPNGHSTAEVFYNGGWHFYDSDEDAICLMPDNKTVASEEQIVADHWVMKRTHIYGPLHDDDLMRDEGSAALFAYEGERQGEHPGKTSHQMDFTLRPGEAITWAWNAGNRYHGREFGGSEAALWNKRWRLMADVMNGELTHAADLTQASTLKYFETQGVEIRPSGPFGRALYPVAGKGSVIVPVKSAYPVVGGRLDVDLGRRSPDGGQAKVSISFDEGKTWQEVWTSSMGDYARMYIDLDEFFPRTAAARYNYLLRFDLTSPGPQPDVCLKSFYLRSTLQMARLAMPGVTLGDNEFVYTDQSAPERKVKITHSWAECDAPVVPLAPAAALDPADGGQASGTRITFRWQPPATGAPAADYEFQLSEFPDLRYVLSSNFEKIISRTDNRGTSTYQLPHMGLLNPGQTYYWRVRARSEEGVWGPWSKAFSFAAQAPAVAVNVNARFDPARRTVQLGWDAGSGGSTPVRYRIYGSAERGFTAHDTPYTYDAGADGMKPALPNLLMETQGPTRSVTLPTDLWRAYYRVVAVDSEGRESGPSGHGELVHPLILSKTLPAAKAAAYYQARIDVSASIGDLVSTDFPNGQPYNIKFRNADDLVFEVTGAPHGLTISRDTGVLAGYLPATAAGKYILAIKVTDKRTGKQDAVKLPLTVSSIARKERN
jgi:hypothetical protein